MKKVICLCLTVAMFISVLSVSSFAIIDTNGGIMGDADNNGKLEIADARAALKAAAGIEPFESEDIGRSDIDGDGVISVSDARAIFRASVGLQDLDIGGAFTGFDGGNYFNTADELVEYFNTNLNKIKTSRPGFTKTTEEKLKDFNIEEDGAFGIVEKGTIDNIKSKITENINSSNDTSYINKGTACYNEISYEGEDYVSEATADDLMGATAVVDEKKNTLEITVCVKNTEKAELSTSGYSKLLNPANMEEDGIVTALGYVNQFVNADGFRTTYKNGVFKATFDLKTNNVIEYKASYDVNIFALGNEGLSLGSILSILDIFKLFGGGQSSSTVIKLNSINYESEKTFIYNEFVW